MISGQHTVKALLELRAVFIKESRKLPRWLEVVRATMLRPDTPVHWRQMAAGDEQFKQSRAKALKVSDFATHLLGTEEVRQNPNDLTRLGWALRKCGFDRETRPVCIPH